MFRSESEVEDRLARPSAALVADLAGDTGDLVVLGAGGKMGPSLCRLARRGLDAAGRTGDRVYAVSRWSDRAAADALAADGVEPVTFDLLGDVDLAGLPDAADVVFMVGAKFGTAAAPHLAWMVNTVLPAAVARRYPTARIAAFSTGNVYPMVPVTSGGSVESDPPGPIGDYAMSCLGREQVFAHAAATRGTPVAVLRLNYAVDLRYGVLADIGQAVLAGEPVDVTTGHVNVVWQGYANEVALRSLRHASPDVFVLNLTGPETASVRRIAARMGERLGRPVSYVGTEASTALLNDATRCHALFGYPDVPLGTLIDWQADSLAAGLPTSGKPTRFTVRDGRF
ncbi:NAD-dependent epimerase/dehydratase family protein [Micromonospora cathayae]|uniref:NAD-dependent epimerase/dehydratase family protein n=1 Tax=Micromonospora cathayae TaxID=3028804 RepID=A0ABY7ZLI5_9ACTN|nr:NAD-dependent epimerase/dehydratase family protein [Micromonospora sp. HUAS 3]WDZ83872.1 NAD-dependent epimerase/dehydratase family protein [Micromonospora sp. HUAS 3]